MKNTNRTKLTYLLSYLLILFIALMLIACSESVFQNEIGLDDQIIDSDGNDPNQPEIKESGHNNRSTGENGSAEPEPVRDLPVIGIYSGAGSWDVNVEAFKRFFDHYGYQWAEFDENDAIDMDLTANFDLLWFPGGFAAEYKNYISSHDNIRDFIENGGMFAGSCAGAYYASDILRWLNEDHEYPLKLFEGKAAGPLTGQIAWGEVANFILLDNIPANADFEPQLPVYYFDGPYFSPYNDQTITVLARYEVNNEPAVIAGRFGEGSYLLFGPHPELGGYSSSSPDFNLDGGEGAQWPWLNSVLTWFYMW
ncbi:MAG: BPL-N domain-containing protein [Dethiobacteria bacterium]